MRTQRLSCEVLESRITPTVLPEGFAEEVLVTSLTRPTALQLVPDGRMFIAEQDGAVKVIQGDMVLAEPFIVLPTDGRGERGVLGITIDPDFETNQYVYVYYTVIPNEGPTFNRISRFTADGNKAVPGSEFILVELDPNIYGEIHNGGAIHFGPDGKLYVATGDNGLSSNAQSLTTTHGKILRYNSDGTIPDDNPTSFAGVQGTTEGEYRAIWAIGLRNPFTFSFQPGTGRMFINDVGQERWEEVNEGFAGLNYGWPRTEGYFNQSAFPDFTQPIYAYAHAPLGPDLWEFKAISGSAFYNPATVAFPTEYLGGYFFGDFVDGNISFFDLNNNEVTEFASTLTGYGLVDIDITPQGDLIYLTRGMGQRGTGGLYRIRYTQEPLISEQPLGVRVFPGESATFSVVANGAGILEYQWLRNGEEIPGARSATLVIDDTTLDDNGAYFNVVITNEFGSTTSQTATLTVTPNNPPIPLILAPLPGSFFIAGQTYRFEGSATDAEDGELGAASLTWRIDYHTGDAPPRPFYTETEGITEGEFTIPTATPYLRPDVFYRIYLTATDSNGDSTTISRDLLPITPVITLQANLPNVEMTLNGQPVTSPHEFIGVAGVLRQFVTPTSVVQDGITYKFVGWSDGVTTAAREVNTPSVRTTFTARYEMDLEATNAALPPRAIVVGAGAGFEPIVRGIDPTTGAELAKFDLRALGFAEDFPSEARVARADVTGNGIPDLIIGAGPGGPSYVVVIDGLTGEIITSLTAFEDGFTGGVFVAAGDIDGDGKADLIISPDQGGGPRVRILKVDENHTPIADFLGIEDPDFRGGARVAVGDVDGDGTPDVVVAAGFLGGPRVAGWSGKSLITTTFEKVFGDFFAFESTLRNGVFVAVGDVNGDGKADLILGGGPGGGPRVLVLDSQLLNKGTTEATLGNFFAGTSASRDGVRVAAQDLNGDGKADVVTGLNGQVKGYPGTALSKSGTPLPYVNHLAFDEDFLGPVFVG